MLGLLNCIMSVGSICALPVVPYSADILGRRTSIIIGASIMVLGVILQTLGFNFGMFVGARFLIGFGVAIAHGSSPLLIAELVHPQHRAIYTAIYNTTWYLGSFVAAWLTFGEYPSRLVKSKCVDLEDYRHKQNRGQLGLEGSFARPGFPICVATFLHLVRA